MSYVIHHPGMIMFDIYYFTDVPSFGVVFISIAVVWIATTHSKALLFDQIILPLGLMYVLIEEHKSLDYMSDPTTIGPMYSFALIPLSYAGVFYLINKGFVCIPFQEKHPGLLLHQGIRSFGATFMLFCGVFLMIQDDNPQDTLLFMNFPTFVFIFATSTILAHFDSVNNKRPFFVSLRLVTVYGFLLWSLLSAMPMINTFHDPTEIPNHFSPTLLGGIYALFIYCIASIYLYSSAQKHDYYENTSQFALLIPLVALSLIPIGFWTLPLYQ